MEAEFLSLWTVVHLCGPDGSWGCQDGDLSILGAARRLGSSPSDINILPHWPDEYYHFLHVPCHEEYWRTLSSMSQALRQHSLGKFLFCWLSQVFIFDINANSHHLWLSFIKEKGLSSYWFLKCFHFKVVNVMHERAGQTYSANKIFSQEESNFFFLTFI